MANVENDASAEQLKKPTHIAASNLRPKQQTVFMRKALSVILRLSIWYFMITTFFRCPSNLNDLDGHSPRVCEPYLIARSNIEPHLAPYYQVYGKPYVEAVQPYTQTFHDNIYLPVADVSSQSYNKYLAPRIKQGLQRAEKEWDILISPRLDSLKKSFAASYEASIGPHITQAKFIITPKYNFLITQLIELRDGYILPIYDQLRPIVDRICVSIREFLIRTVIPCSRKGWSKLVLLLNGTLRPQVAGLYSKNVEPQLFKIGEKLASYREGGKLKHSHDEAERYGQNSTVHVTETFSPLPDSLTYTSANRHTSSATTSLAATSDIVPDTTSLSPSRQTAQVKIASDLKLWQEKFAVAADKGCDEVEKEVAAILKKLQESGAVNKGENLVSQLDAVSQQQLQKLRAEIIELVQNLSNDSSEEDEAAAQDALAHSLRFSGVTIREHAHNLRMWYKTYDNDLIQRISEIINSTLDILSHIRDLGLQEIGMRWAWMDGVTYKDWAKFHALKKRFSEWQDEVRDVGMRHESLLKAREAGDDILSRGMAVAEKAAGELLMLKTVGAWKIRAGDSSDNFDTGAMDSSRIRSRTVKSEGTTIQPKTAINTESTSPSLGVSSDGSRSPINHVSGESEKQKNDHILRSAGATLVPEEGLFSEAVSLVSDAVNEAESLSRDLSRSAASEPMFSIHDQVADAYSKSIQEASSLLASHTIDSLTTTTASSTASNPGSAGRMESVKHAPDFHTQVVMPGTPANEAHGEDVAISIEDDEISPLDSSKQSKLRGNPSPLSNQADPLRSEQAAPTNIGHQTPTKAADGPSTTPPLSILRVKEILTSANHQFRSLIDSVSVGVQAPEADHYYANSILDDAVLELASAASVANSALTHAIYTSPDPTPTTQPRLRKDKQQILSSAVAQLGTFSTIVDVYLQQLRRDIDESDPTASVERPASNANPPTSTSNTIRDEL
ncbi:hypothetical protein LOZ12_001808 [Ophidiomyces ophidiicola]|nr:hypothetical protein LOZ60_002464 [Ophidiomyces ophidiicola]KAI1953621.1 hypothetical protein LOZ62_000981 [Ophidiomyces ophidiicola]KAI1973640.1 hypothetical protein LOZ56_001737 [Ophidiomyces ophidiicola]KAI2007723.1 hypothetical protein LOZ50_002382 [Ophidiomyces ophidiicola]KAI2020074.1 hypothetical protein LOZ46_002993 [Ophidiomyces ophidiicola]